MGFINFFKSLICNDYDRDNYVYFKEWQSVLSELRIELKEKQSKSLFDSFTSGNIYKMNYELILEKLIP